MGLDYKKYILGKKERALYVLLLIFSGTIMFYLMFANLFPSFILSFPGLIFLKNIQKNLIVRRQKELLAEFADFLYVFANSVGAGRSLASAFIQTQRDLRFIYPEEAYIIREIDNICLDISMNIPPEKSFKEFASRTGIEDLENFSEVLILSQRTGSNLEKSIYESANLIRDKIEIEREIETILAKQKLETRILILMPFIMLIMIRLMNPGYMDALRDNILGYLIILISFTLILVASLWAKKISEVDY